MSLVPFALTSSHNRPHLAHLESFPELRVLCVDDPATRPFALLLNHTNQLAFGGGKNMGMPLWVMLDCGILSSAIVGFAAPPNTLTKEERTRIGLPQNYAHDLAPLSEYCACPTVAPDTVSGFSLQSQRTGQGLARRTKALAMLLYGARKQVGVTQFDNAAIRVHASFGPLRLAIHRPCIHTHAEKSFVYHAILPPEEILLQMAHGTLTQAPYTLPDGDMWRFDPMDESHHERASTLLEQGSRLWLVPPAWTQDAQGRITLDILMATS